MKESKHCTARLQMTSGKVGTSHSSWTYVKLMYQQRWGGGGRCVGFDSVKSEAGAAAAVAALAVLARHTCYVGFDTHNLLSRASTFTFLQFHTVCSLKKCTSTLIKASHRGQLVSGRFAVAVFFSSLQSVNVSR